MSQGVKIGIVTGLRFEAAIINRWRGALGASAPMVEVAGADLDLAHDKARSLASRGAEALISFGVAGALSPDLPAGSLVLPTAVRNADGASHTADQGWNARLAGDVLSNVVVSHADLVSVAEPVASATGKHALAAASNAGAVDMESFGVAAAAREHALPFIAVRAISDEADQDLPAAVANAVAPDGRINVSTVLLNLLASPGQMPAVLRLARHNARAKRTLTRVAHRALPWFSHV